MTIEVALSSEPRKYYPFNRLSTTANVLIMPGLHSASISTNLVKEFTGGIVIGPILVGLEKSVQIIRMNADSDSIINMASLASVYSGS